MSIQAAGPDARCSAAAPASMRWPDTIAIASCAVERQPAGQHLEDDGAEAVDVRPRVHRAAGQLLGRGIGHRADELVRPVSRVSSGAAGRSRRRSPRACRRARHRRIVRDDVGRLEVAMDDAAGVRECSAVQSGGTMRRTSSTSNWPRDASSSSGWGRSAAPSPGTAAADRPRCSRGSRRWWGGGAAAQTRLSRRNRSSGPGPAMSGEDHLDRDLVAEQDAPRAIHRAHPAFRQRRDNLVAVRRESARADEARALISYRPRHDGSAGMRAYRNIWPIALAQPGEETLDGPAHALLDRCPGAACTAGRARRRPP